MAPTISIRLSHEIFDQIDRLAIVSGKRRSILGRELIEKGLATELAEMSIEARLVARLERKDKPK